jgi:chaperonin GroES
MSAYIAQQDSVSAPPEPEITKRFDLDEILNSPNLAEKLDGDLRKSIGRWVVGGYVKDLSSRTQWAERNAEAMKLALQLKEMKTFPWTGASNVKFPLITVGALQFLARISILTKGSRLADFRIQGKDPDGQKLAKAKRVSNHINMQLTDYDLSWADMDEKTKFAAALIGSSFKKTAYDAVSGSNSSSFVPAQNFVVDYNCKDLATASRYTEVINMDDNKLTERINRKVFIKEENAHASSPDQIMVNMLERASREIQGLSPNAESEDVRVLEQYCWLDLDGDGYREPYVVSVREDTGHLYRIVARFYDDGSIHRRFDARQRQFENLANLSTDPTQQSILERRAMAVRNSKDNTVIRIDPVEFYTKYDFVPSPDGGFYGLGLGALLGPVNEAVNSVLNQLIDAGTMSNTGGGWIARGARMKAGKTSFDPFEWKPIDSTGDDLRKSIFPLPVREPSDVLFNLLGVLISYGEKISSATDIMTGVSPGQNTPATTSQVTVEQGMMLFSGIHGRMYRSFRHELTIYYKLNQTFFHHSPKFWELTQGPDAILEADDYRQSGFRVFPSADPTVVSMSQRKQKAGELVQAALTPIGAMWDKAVVSRKWLEANEWDVEEIFPDPEGPRAVKPPVDPKSAIAQAKLQQDQQEHHDTMLLETAKLQQTAALNQAKILELKAQASEHMAKADGEQSQQQISMINARIGALKLHNETILKGADLALKKHKAGTDTENHYHSMMMDVQDRLTAKESAGQENLPATPDVGGQNTSSQQPNGGAA